METITTETKVYNLADINKDSDLKEKVLKENYDINVSFEEWHEPELNNWKEILNRLGFADSTIHYSGFSSQGDGACFVTDDTFYYFKGQTAKIKEEYPTFTELHEIADRLQAVQKRGVYGLYGTITHRGHYSHHNSMDVEVFNRVGNCVNDSIQNEYAGIIKDLAKMIYKGLEKEYDYLTTEEAILITIAANDYKFTEDGELY